MKSFSTFDRQLFLTMAKDIIDAVNVCFKTQAYTAEHIEIIQSVKDYGDGKGPQHVSCAAIRSPIDGKYDFQLDLIGTPEEALLMLKETVEKLIQAGVVNPNQDNKIPKILN